MVIILMVVCALLKMAEGALIKKYNSKHSEGGFIFSGIVTLFAMLFFVFTDKNSLEFPPLVWLFGIAAGVCYFSATIFTYMALGCGSFALTMMILSYAMILSIIYGIAFLKEPLTLFTCIGIILVLISIYFIRAENKEKTVKKSITPFWILAMVISVFTNGFVGILTKMQQVSLKDAYSNEFMIVCLGFSTVTLLTVGALKERGKVFYILKNGGIYAALAGLSNGAKNLFNLIAQMIIPVSLLAPLGAGINNLVTFLFAFFVFKEKLSKKQIIGALLGTLALVLFNM